MHAMGNRWVAVSDRWLHEVAGLWGVEDSIPHRELFPTSSPQIQRGRDGFLECDLWWKGRDGLDCWPREDRDINATWKPEDVCTLNRLRCGSNALLITSSRNSLNTPVSSIPASSRPYIEHTIIIMSHDVCMCVCGMLYTLYRAHHLMQLVEVT